MRHEKDPRFLSLFDVSRVGGRGRSSRDLPTRVGFLLLMVVLAGSVWLNYRHTRLLHEQHGHVTNTRKVIGQVRKVLGQIVDAETGVRGYLLTGSDSHLAPYLDVAARVDEGFAELERQTPEGEPPRILLPLLKARARAKIAYLDHVVAIGRAGNMEEAIGLLRLEGKRLMDACREVAAEIEVEEEALLVQREASALTSYRTAQTTGLVVGVSGLFLVVVIYSVVGRFERLRSRAISEISAAREGFRAALASIGDAVLVTDAEGRLVFCNEVSRTLLRIRSEDVGRPVADLITSIAEPSGERRELIAPLVRSGNAIERTAPDTAVRFPDGSTIPIDASAANIPGQDGQSCGVILIVRDMTERRERERERARGNERFSSLVLATSQIVYTADASGLVREDSPSWRRVTGQSYEEWKGYGWLEALHPDDRSRVGHGWAEAIEGRRPYAGEYRLRTADGSYRWSMARVVPVVETDGGVREWVGMIHDIHARKQAEEALQEASRRKDEFIALLAHELRNPLAPLRNGLEILKTGARTDAAHAIEMMDRQVQHMVRLIDDLLDVSRIREGKLELRRERVDLREILSQSIDVVRSASQTRHQHLAVSLPETPMWVEGDSVRLTQVVTNLLSNAVKYSDDDASIWLAAQREGTRHVVSVRDTGQGIPLEMQPRIWDLFLQGDHRAERVGGGLGIGLTLVKRLVELHGGTVEVHSEGIGTGSEFTVRLPVAAAPAGSAPPASAPARPLARPLRILVIDDNEDSAVSLSMLLRVEGHTVRMAFQGEEGFQQFAGFEPDLVLCDIRMPDMSGHEVARRLRALPEGARPLLVALTGFGTGADREASLRAGFDRHLVKPVDPSVLSEVIREAGARQPQAPGPGRRA